METALRHELIQAIPELNNQIHPTNAPEGATGPYLVYARINTNKTKTLEGYTGDQALSYMFSIMATKYSDMVRVRNLVEKLLIGDDDSKGLAQREIGDATKFYIEDLDINNVDETWENELKVNRGIIDFTIYF